MYRKKLFSIVARTIYLKIIEIGKVMRYRYLNKLIKSTAIVIRLFENNRKTSGALRRSLTRSFEININTSSTAA